MPKGPKQKQKLLHLASILMKQTDEDHVLSMEELLSELSRCGVEAERKSVYDDLEQLKDFGLDIVCRRGKNGGYALVSRDFELAELKLLVDAIQSSRFITEKKSAELISKIEGLTSTHQARALHRQVYVTGRLKTLNESIYYNIDTLHSAITAGKQIGFRYFEWQVDFGIPEKMRKQYRHNGKIYEVSPWALCWDDENYYLVAYDGENEQIRHYRVDKMENITAMNRTREGQKAFERFDMASYAKMTFGMFGGEEKRVTLTCDNAFAAVIRDRFGSDLMLRPCDESHFIVAVSVRISPQFFAWVFGLAGGVRVVEPQDVVDAYHAQLESALQ